MFEAGSQDHQVPHRESVMLFEGGASTVRAIHDVGCLTAVKFVYYFPEPVTYDDLTSFDDCDIVVREFSKMIRLASDLVSIKRAGEFGADFIVGGTRAVVYFDGSTKVLPRATIGRFARRLRLLGYDRVLHSQGPRPQCDQCPTGILKGCGSTKT